MGTHGNEWSTITPDSEGWKVPKVPAGYDDGDYSSRVTRCVELSQCINDVPEVCQIQEGQHPILLLHKLHLQSYGEVILGAFLVLLWPFRRRRKYLCVLMNSLRLLLVFGRVFFSSIVLLPTRTVVRSFSQRFRFSRLEYSLNKVLQRMFPLDNVRSMYGTRAFGYPIYLLHSERGIRRD